MLTLSLRNWVDWLRHPRSRADELLELQARLTALAKEELPEEERLLAEEMRALRKRISITIGMQESCTVCAKGCPQPTGRWDGGLCCSGRTAGIFSDDELAALHAGGTRYQHLRAPHDDHAGCAFRGALGCSLSSADRPNLCLRYLCDDLKRALVDQDKLDLVDRMTSLLMDKFEEFVALRHARLDLTDDPLAELERELLALHHRRNEEQP